MSETAQAGLSSWSARELVEPQTRTSVDRAVRCPDCFEAISATKGGQPLPDGLDTDAERTFGWRCADCHNVIPCRAFNPAADTFNDNYRGVEVEFRGGHRRFIPVPKAGDRP
jgi:hypothetical protein